MNNWIRSLMLATLILTACSHSSSQQTPVVITQVVIVTATTPPTMMMSTLEATPTSTQPPTIESVTQVSPSNPNPTGSFAIQSVDVMKWSQDVLRNQPSDQFMMEMVELIRDVGATHVAISVPYDSPSDLPESASVEFTQRWVRAIRAAGLSVWFRQSPLSFKGFYDTPINPNLQTHIDTIATYIRANEFLFKKGDIFTPIPEPQVERTRGINCFSESCLFRDVNHLAQFMYAATQSSSAAFTDIGLGNEVIIGRWGLDGFILWGDRNPDWEGKPQTAANGQLLADADDRVICIDHYFPADADPHAELQKIRMALPNTQLWLCEWGPIEGQSPEYVQTVLQAALDNQVITFNWWQSGPGGKEALFELGLDNSIKTTPYYEVLRQFFRSN